MQVQRKLKFIDKENLVENDLANNSTCINRSDLSVIVEARGIPLNLMIDFCQKHN